jgi:hypothetical protein
MKQPQRYFNFPIQLINGFLDNHLKCLNELYCYSVYAHSLKLNNADELIRVELSANYFGMQSHNYKNVLVNGKELYNSIDVKSPKAGLSVKVWFDFYKNEKTEFEKVSLLAFLALKSILQNKSYCKVTNEYLLSRMNGNAKSGSFSLLPESLKVYANEYQTKKIKRELCSNWGLVTYSRYTRGFYVSFSMSLDSLVLQAEKRRLSNQSKALKSKEDEAVKKALYSLGINTTNARP